MTGFPDAVCGRIAMLLIVVMSLGVLRADAQVGISSNTSQPLAYLEGQIVDSVSGDPIPGVLVRTDSGHEAFTDQLGRFELTGLPEGERLLALMTEDCRITWGQVTSHRNRFLGEEPGGPWGAHRGSSLG